MIEHIGRVNMDYMVRLANDPDWARAELAKVEAYNWEHGARFGEDPIPVSIKPNFISPRQRRIIESAVGRLHAALGKFIDLWLESDELQALWGLPAEQLEVMKIDPGYPDPIQVARFDGFMEDYRLKFLEFNCDSPGGAGYSDIIHEAFLEMYARNDDMESLYQISQRERCAQLADALLDCYAAWRAGGREDRSEAPYVVVSDWNEVDSRPDIEITVAKFRERGIDAHFADPRDLEHREDGLYHGNDRIDLVYKRVIVKELLAEPKAAPLLEAYRAGDICLVNSPRSVIVGNKKILAALRRPEVLSRLTSEERTAVREHVPWTEVLRDEKVEFKGFQVNLRDFVLDNKDKLVLKAAESYGGKDVFLGFETDAETWRALMEEHLDDNAWVVQQLVAIPKELFPRIADDEVKMELMNVNINPFAFGGRYAGSYTRISRKNVINVSAGGGIAPTITVTPPEAAP